MDLAELPKTRPFALWNARRDGFEIAVMGQQNAVAVLSNLGDQWIR
jgi:hypothetical protein